MDIGDWSYGDLLDTAAGQRRRIAELTSENARLREAAEKQRAILNNYSLAPDIHKLLRQLHEQILGVGDE